MNRTIKLLLIANCGWTIMMTIVILFDLLFIHHQGAIQAIVVSAILVLICSFHYTLYHSLSWTTDTGNLNNISYHIILYLMIELLVGYAGVFGVISRAWFDNGGYAIFG